MATSEVTSPPGRAGPGGPGGPQDVQEGARGHRGPVPVPGRVHRGPLEGAEGERRGAAVGDPHQGRDRPDRDGGAVRDRGPERRPGPDRDGRPGALGAVRGGGRGGSPGGRAAARRWSATTRARAHWPTTCGAKIASFMAELGETNRLAAAGRTRRRRRGSGPMVGAPAGRRGSAADSTGSSTEEERLDAAPPRAARADLARRSTGRSSAGAAASAVAAAGDGPGVQPGVRPAGRRPRRERPPAGRGEGAGRARSAAATSWAGSTAVFHAMAAVAGREGPRERDVHLQRLARPPLAAGEPPGVQPGAGAVVRGPPRGCWPRRASRPTSAARVDALLDRDMADVDPVHPDGRHPALGDHRRAAAALAGRPGRVPLAAGRRRRGGRPGGRGAAGDDRRARGRRSRSGRPAAGLGRPDGRRAGLRQPDRQRRELPRPGPPRAGRGRGVGPTTAARGRRRDRSTYYVRDNGLGIPEAYQAKLFMAFQRLHPRRRPGEGIGLALVRRMVERHGGTDLVRVEPRASGARSTSTLPGRPAGRGPRRASAEPPASVDGETGDAELWPPSR